MKSERADYALHSVETYQGNKLTHNSSGNVYPTNKHKKKQAGTDSSNVFPKIFTCEERAMTIHADKRIQHVEIIHRTCISSLSLLPPQNTKASEFFSQFLSLKVKSDIW